MKKRFKRVFKRSKINTQLTEVYGMHSKQKFVGRNAKLGYKKDFKLTT